MYVLEFILLSNYCLLSYKPFIWLLYFFLIEKVDFSREKSMIIQSF